MRKNWKRKEKYILDFIYIDMFSNLKCNLKTTVVSWSWSAFLLLIRFQLLNWTTILGDPVVAQPWFFADFLQHMNDVGWLVGSCWQCFGSAFTESGSKYFFEFGSGSSLLLNTDPIRIQTKIFYDKFVKIYNLNIFLSNTVMYVFLNP